jgi:teichuronic acid biosynthesis glycosyltransferase TuaH
VLHVVACAPWPLGRPLAGIARASRAACAAMLRRALQMEGIHHVDVALIDQPLFEEILDAVAPGCVVYRPTDMHPSGPLAAAESRLIARADGVVATSEVVHESLGTRANEIPSLILENGVEVAHFAPAYGEVGTGAVYLGVLDQRFDWETVGYAARALPGLSFTLAGPLRAAVPFRLPANVKLAGPVRYEEAPALLSSAAVGLLPLNENQMNSGRSPMKFYEYLAAGLRVVARETPALCSKHAPGVTFYGSREEAARMIAEQTAQATPNAAGAKFARAFDWSERAAELLAFVDAVRAS